MSSHKTTRLFFLKNSPPGLEAYPSVFIRMGCLTSASERSVWIEQFNRELKIRIEDARSALKSDITISHQEFEHLWTLTSKKSVELRRYFFTEGEWNIEIDLFEGVLAPHALVRMAFHSTLGRRRFRKPPYLGAEISNPQAYDLRSLAFHGMPLEEEPDVQIGSLPFLYKNGVLHVVLVTSSSGTRWLIPKGHTEPGMSNHEVALMEAAEEAGVVGIIDQDKEVCCTMEDHRKLHLYPLRVATLLPHWPEKLARRRVVIPIYHALLRINDAGLARGIRDLSRLLKP